MRAAELRLGGSGEALTEAVAKNLFKLMSYKDEYEVARLYARSDFLERVRETFSGDYRLKLNLAPPLLGGAKDAEGRPRKREFGPWMLQFMRLLARGKMLRGTLFDPFGFSAERRAERRLITDYRAMLEEILPLLSAANHGHAVALANLPDQVRGFGPVKAQAIGTVRTEYARLMRRFRGTDETVRIVEPA